MAGTTLSDVIVPEVFTPYVVKQSMVLSAFWQSGIVTNDAQFDTLASAAATSVNMPFFTDLSGDSEAVVEGADLTADKVGTKQDAAVLVRRAKMWSSTDLAAALAGKNPVDVIAGLVAQFWARDMQKELFAILAGVFGTAGMADLLSDITALAGNAAKFSGSAFIDACQLMGDAKENLTAIAVHSAVETYMEKADLLATIKPSDGGAPIKTYQGKRVIVDDGCPYDAGTGAYTTYIFGAGAVALGNGSPVGFVATETDRDKKKASGVEYLINRKQFILHPRGIKWLGASVANAEGPTRLELADPDNWLRVYDPKQLRIVALKHLI